MAHDEREREGTTSLGGRVARTASKAGALMLSVGVVGALMFRAGGLGCSAPEPVKEPAASVEVPPPASAEPAAQGSGAPTTAATTDATSAPSAPPVFMGGTKSGIMPPGLLQPVDPTAKPSNANPPPSGSKPTKHFPGTKSGTFE